MNGRSFALGALVALAFAAIVAMSIGLWPSHASPPPQRADLRKELALRHAPEVVVASEGDGTARGEPSAPTRVLDAYVLCDASRAGRLSLVAGPPGEGPRLLSACGEGLALWQLGGAQPLPLLKIALPNDALALGPAAAADFDGDGAWDLVFGLEATAPAQAFRQGLYLVRGRVAGGFEAPLRVGPLRVTALSVDTRGEAPVVWAALREPPPGGRALLWQLRLAGSPERLGQWELKAPAVALSLGSGVAEDALLGLSPPVLWRKSLSAQDPPASVLEAPGARDLAGLGTRLFLLDADGARAVVEGDDGQIVAGDPEGPAGLDALGVSLDGSRWAVQAGKLWTFRGAQAPHALAGVGGASVQDLVSGAGRSWAWLTGLSGAQAAGLVALPSQWAEGEAATLLVHDLSVARFEAALGVP